MAQRSLPDRLTALGLPVLVIFGVPVPRAWWRRMGEYGPYASALSP
jgi:hypothetical protein